jgi:hypothetical protein
MKTFKEIREGYVSAAQRKAVWASRADGGKGHPDNKKKSKKEDAVADFLAKGGKIKKLPPAKAQGYHGKDDPGKGMAGMMDKGDTKGLPRKKVKSMGEAKQTHMFDNEKDARAKAKEIGGKYVKGTGKSMGKHAAIKEGDEKPPFDPPYRKAGEPRKDKFGNVVKNVPRHLARQAARDLLKKKQNNEGNLDELSYDKMNKYYDAAKKSKDRATNSAVATILRKGDHSQDLKTRAKRIKGMDLAKTRSIKKIRGDK